MSQEYGQDDIMCFGLMLGPKSTYLHCLCGALLHTLTYQGTYRAVGFGQFAFAFPVSSFIRIKFQSVFYEEEPCK